MRQPAVRQWRTGMFSSALVCQVAAKVSSLSPLTMFLSPSILSRPIGTCQDDLGGPLMMFGANRRWMLVGVISNGIGCAQSDYSGLYTRVAFFQDWIKSSTNSSIWVGSESGSGNSTTPTMSGGQSTTTMTATPMNGQTTTTMTTPPMNGQSTTTMTGPPMNGQTTTTTGLSYERPIDHDDDWPSYERSIHHNDD